MPMPDSPPDQSRSDEPARPAAQYLAELRERGFTVLDNVIGADALERIRAATQQQVQAMSPSPPESDDRFGVPDCTAWSIDICRAVVHPVALSIIRSYLGTEEIHFCHQPVMTILRPTVDLLGTYPDSGWHSDYPYHPDVYPEDRWNDADIYGVQFNICIDEFRPDNAATQYVPGSHLRQAFPPIKMNEGGTRVGVPPHENVHQMQAPAGAALIYDSRTWHRACVELNLSGEDRLAVLNAVSPNWVRPMADKLPGTNAFHESGIEAQLSDRERLELGRLCHAETAAVPEGAPQILEKQLKAGRLNL